MEKTTGHPVKIVIRFADGQIEKGYPQDFFPNKPMFHLFKKLSPSDSSMNKEIRVSELKAIFFVKSFAGNPNYKERKRFVNGDLAQGRTAEVVFLDGEILQGSVLGYDPKSSGFSFFLQTQRAITEKSSVFVMNSALRKFRYMEEEKTQKSPRNDYQSLIPDARGKLLMVNDEERAVLKLVLSKVMETPSGREYIVESLGKSYLKIAADLLKQMEED
jgi:hypothetical protein